MFKRINLKSIVLLSLLAVGAATFHRMDGAALIGQQAFWGSLVPLPAEAAGAIIYVDASASGADTGANWTDAYPNLQDALAVATSIDQIWVAAGVYYPDEGGGMTDDDRTMTFTLIDGVEMYGGFAGGETLLSQRDWGTNVTVLSGDIDQNDKTDPNGVVIDAGDIAGSNAYHVVMGGGANSSAVLDGFTITAGHAFGLSDKNGGGMENLSSSPTLTNLNFSGNWAEHNGGGMRNYQSSPTLTNVSFTGNQASGGGGMDNYSSSNPTLTNVSFTGNMASNDGGGMSNGSNSSPTLTNVSFTGNQALGSGSGTGGGMYTSGGTPTLTNVTFSGNQAMGGGGMFNLNCSPSLTNVSFSGNQADYGGGMLNDNTSLDLLNISFSGNRATTTGGGMYNLTSDGIFLHLIMWNNGGGSIINGASSPTIAYSVIEGCGGSGFMTWNSAVGVDGGNNLDVDPLFVMPIDPATAPTTAGDLHLQFGSPAVDTGYNPFCPVTDLDGYTRPIDGDLDGSAECDMGAYEKTIDLFLPLIMR
jgi:hypothetical protein